MASVLKAVFALAVNDTVNVGRHWLITLICVPRTEILEGDHQASTKSLC